MKRRIFLKKSTLAGLVICSNPVFPFYLSDISFEELIGQGNPKLFGDGYKLRKEANKAFLDMKVKAFKDGINIQIVSSYRDFNHQKIIWTRKYNSFTENGILVANYEYNDVHTKKSYMHTIENNTLNDKPLYYFKNQKDTKTKSNKILIWRIP